MTKILPKARTTNKRLVIFDCDGVLVDSESIAIDVLRETVAEAGYSLDEDLAFRLFVGKSRQDEERLLREQLAMHIDQAVLQQMRSNLQRQLQHELKPIPGIAETLGRLGRLRCVASSSAMERICLSLSMTGLLGAFEPHIFSADAVANGKPAPDLFLQAASAMGIEPSDCVVVEDSPVGIQAAQLAGMSVFAFMGGSHAGPAGLHQAARMLEPDALFSDMRDLPDLISALETGDIR